MKIRLLGPLEAQGDGDPVNLGPSKQRLILAALLLARGRVVPRHELLDMVWADDPPASAVGTLQAYVSRTRALLRRINADAVALVRQPPGYRLAGARTDLDEFERLSEEADAALRAGQWLQAHAAAEKALALWRGPLLADLPDHAWIERERRRAEERMERCVEVLATALLGQGRTADALEQARRLLDAQPRRGRAAWLYMLALHRCGRSAEALEVYQVHAHDLDEELGLQPVQELRELQTAILREDPALACWPNQPSGVEDGADRAEVARVAPARPVDGSAATRLVGRSETMERVERWLDEVYAGESRWLLFTGPGGIGKTRLAHETVRRFHARGRQVAWSVCVHDEGVPSWWALRPLVRQLGGDPDEMFRVPSDVDEDSGRFAVYGRLLDLLGTAAADGPVLLVLDDVQWLDPASARAVAHLVPTMRELAVGVVLTLRDGARRPEVDAVLAASARHPAATQIRVDALDDDGVAELLGELAGGPVPASEVASLGQQTGGNPLLLTEYARLAGAERATGEIPLAVQEVLGRRFDRFGPEALRVLHTAAVAGDGFEPSLLAAATGSSLARIVDVLDAAAHDAIIVPGPVDHGYQFAHALLRQHLLGTLSTVRQQALHAGVAAALALRDGPDEDILRRAHHLSAAIPIARTETVVAACRQAAEYAESVGDWDVAARHWAAARSALGARRRGGGRELHDDFLFAEVVSLARAGQGRTLLEVVASALRQAGGPHHGRTAARLSRALLRSSGAWPWTANGEGAATVLDRLTRASETVRADVVAQIALSSARAVGSCYAPDLRLAEDLSRHAIALADELGDPDTLADALIGRALTVVGVASCSTEVVTLLDRLDQLPHRHASVDSVLRHNILTMATFSLGDVAATQQHLRLAIAGSDALRLPVSRVQLRWVEAMLAHWGGDLALAEELALAARQHHEQTELYGSEENFLSASLAIAWDRGTLSEAGPSIRRAADPLVWSAMAAAEAGDRARGLELVRAALEPAVLSSLHRGPELPQGRRILATVSAGERSHYWYTLGNLCLLAHAIADLRIHELAPRMLDLLMPHARYFASIGQTAPIGPVSFPVGRLQALLGNVGAAQAAYGEAADAAGRGGAGPLLIRVRAAQAELLPPGPERDRRLARVGEQAERAGLGALARRMRMAVSLA